MIWSFKAGLYLGLKATISASGAGVVKEEGKEGEGKKFDLHIIGHWPAEKNCMIRSKMRLEFEP